MVTLLLALSPGVLWLPLLPEHAESSPTASAPALASAAIFRRDVIVFLLVGRMDARVVGVHCERRTGGAVMLARIIRVR
jgi:hypothetical protein